MTAQLQHMVDKLWKNLTDIIHLTASHTVGRLEFDNRTPKDFWTEDLEEARDTLMEDLRVFQAKVLGGEVPQEELKNQAKGLSD